MMGTYFYNKHVRTSVAIFGSLFDNIHVLRTDAAGDVLSQIKVPLSYAPKRNFLERLEEMSVGEEGERRIAMKLPRMSFEMTSMVYDPQRQLPKMNTFQLQSDQDSTRSMYTGVPYLFAFQLQVYAKTQDDALQVVEQIIPFFAPQYTVTVKPFADYPEYKEDIPITMTGVDFQDDYEGPIEQRRTIIYTLNFDMKVQFYGPANTRSIIREVNADLFDIQPTGDLFTSNINITPDPIGVSPNDDYGFNIEITDERIE